jgi:hypothetical protein
VALWALVVATPAGAVPIVLPAPVSLVAPPPPLAGGPTSLETDHELRFPGHIESTERVVVGVRSDGSASSVVVTQRLLITKAGDYSFTIPAPVLNVQAAAGTQSEPGQRNTGIVWQGFSSGRRVLAARASLEPSAAERGLPLAIRIERGSGQVRVRVINVARRKLTLPRGTVSVGELRTALRRAREALQSSDRAAALRTLQVEGSSSGVATMMLDAPVRVRGTIGGRAVSWTLGGGRPLARVVALPRSPAPKLSLQAAVLRPLELLSPGAAADLEHLIVALARVGLSKQYDQYLASPDQVGPSRATYVFESAAGEQTVPQLHPAAGGGSDAVAIVLASVLGGAALAGLVVLWAHS